MRRTDSTNNRMVKQPSTNFHRELKNAINKELICKTVEEQEMKWSELVQEIKDFEFSDVYSCQEKICLIEDANKTTCKKERKVNDYMKQK